LLNSIVLQANMEERWIWYLHASKKHNVRSVFFFTCSR